MTSGIKDISVLDIHALVDNELPIEEKRRLQEYLKQDARLRELYEQMVYQKILLQEWWKQSDSIH